MHNNTAVNKVTGESIPCMEVDGKLYHHGGEDCKPVELGEQWYIQKESLLIPAIFVLMMISGFAIIVYRGMNF